MEIWLPELPDIPLMQFYHRLPLNTTYWTGYPTQEDPYVNPAFFHSTGAAGLPQAPAHAVAGEGARCEGRGTRSSVVSHLDPVPSTWRRHAP